MKKNSCFLGAVIAALMLFGLASCPGPDDPMDPGGPVVKYEIQVDKTSISRYVLSGLDFEHPGDQVITVTNTGLEVISLETDIIWEEGDDGDWFSVTPESLSELYPGQSWDFTVKIDNGDPDGYVYRVDLVFKSQTHEDIYQKVSLTYGTVTLQPAEITVTPSPLQAGVTAKLGSSDSEYTAARKWFSSDDSVALIEGGNVTAISDGVVLIGFITEEYPLLIVKGKKITVYPARVILNPQYPLEGGTLSRPAGSSVGVLNLDIIQTASAGNPVAFTKDGGDTVISALNNTTGALTFANAEESTSGVVTVNMTVTKTVPEGALITHSGAATFTAKIGATPPATLTGAGTINDHFAIHATKVEAQFSEAIIATGSTFAGFTLKKQTGNLTIQNASIAGNRITFDLAAGTPIVYGDTVTISYDNTDGNITSNGTALASFTDRPVNNNLMYVEPGPAMQSVSMDGANRADANKVVIVYDKSPILTNLTGFSIQNVTGASFAFSNYSIDIEEKTITITLNRLPLWSEISADGNNRLRMVYDAGMGNVRDGDGFPGVGGSVFITLDGFDESYRPPEVESVVLNGEHQTSLVITYDKAIATGTGRGGFTLNGAIGLNFTGQAVAGEVLTLAMSRAPTVAEINAGLTLTYNAVNGNVADDEGNRSESFTDKPVTITNEGLFAEPPLAESATILSTALTSLVVEFDKPVSLTSAAGFSLSGSPTATSITGFSGSGTVTVTFTLNLKPALGEVITLAYNATLGNVRDNANASISAPSFSLPVTLSGFNDNVNGRPTVVSAIVDAKRSNSAGTFNESDARDLYVTFNKAVTIDNSAGFSLLGSDTAYRIQSFTGSGTATVVFRMNDWASYNDNLRLEYARNLGNARDANSNLLVDFDKVITKQGYTNETNVDTEPPKFVSGLITNESPQVLRMVFNKAVTLDAAKFEVKVHGTPWINYSNDDANPPAGGTMMDSGIVRRQVTGVTVVPDTDSTVWNLTMDAPAKYGEIIRISTKSAGAAKGHNNIDLPAIPQFIVRSEIKRVKDTWENEPGFYRNGVKDADVTDGTGGQMYDEILRLGKLGRQQAKDPPYHPQAGEVITIVLDSDQTVTRGGPWSSFSHADSLWGNQFGGATIIFTTTMANVNSTNPRTIYINVGNVLPRWAQNNITMVIDKYIVFRQDPGLASRTAGALVYLGDGGKLILDGGEIRGSRSTVTGNNGAAITAGGGSYGGMVLINDGKITDHKYTSTTTAVGEANSVIGITQTVIVVMHGGEISDNEVTQASGSTPLAPRGGVITHFNNSAANHGKSSFYMTGGVIKGNKLLGGFNVPSAGAVIVNGTFMKVGGIIYGAELDPALANTTDFTHAIKANAVVVLTGWNGTIASMTLAQSIRRNATSGPNDVLVLDCAKPNRTTAGTSTVPTWIESFWD